jgi:phosphoglycolate phosphatase
LPDSLPAAAPFPFDAVLFDLDGTLVATDRYWVPAARAAARRALNEAGIARELPSTAAWMALVGYPLREGLARLFPELSPSWLERLHALCHEEEAALLSSGEAALLPGAAAMLEALQRRGVALAIASNCSRAYLDALSSKLGLQRWISTARCLESPGVRNKADMVRQLLEVFGTRSAVLVGDRRGDTEAAHANALPAVHYAGAFAEAADARGAQRVLPELAQLEHCLEGRSRWIAAELEALGGFAPGGRVLGIGGPPASGRSLWARDAARLAQARGRRARALELDDYVLAPRRALGLRAPDPALDFDWPRLAAELARARAAGELVLLAGPYLCGARAREELDALLYLELSDELCLQRVAARAGLGATPELLARVRAAVLPVERESQAGAPQAVDRALNGANPLGPL